MSEGRGTGDSNEGGAEASRTEQVPELSSEDLLRLLAVQLESDAGFAERMRELCIVNEGAPDAEPTSSNHGAGYSDRMQQSGEQRSSSDAGATSRSVPSLHHVPKLPFFSGSAEKKDEVAFDLWAYEVRALQRDGIYQPQVLAQAIRRSLRGAASRTLLHLEGGADAWAILSRLESIYGTVVTDASLLQQFYTEEQQEGESVVAWGSRLQDIVVQLRQRGRLQATDEMLRGRFWTGLRSERIKNATRHRFDSSGTFLEMQAHVRAAEHEFSEAERRKGGKMRPTKASCAAVTETGPDPVAVASAAAVAAVQPLVDRLEALIVAQVEVRQVGREKQFKPSQINENAGCYRCGGLDHFKRGCRAVLPAGKPENGNKPLPGSGQ